MKKLNKTQVKRIRHKYYSTHATLSTLADKYDMSERGIQAIVTGETWKGVGGPTCIDPEKGHSTHKRKITNQQREEIKQRRDNGETLSSIAADYPIGVTQVCNITSGANKSRSSCSLEFDRTIKLPLTEYDFVSEVPA